MKLLVLYKICVFFNFKMNFKHEFVQNSMYKEY